MVIFFCSLILLADAYHSGGDTFVSLLVISGVKFLLKDTPALLVEPVSKTSFLWYPPFLSYMMPIPYLRQQYKDKGSRLEF
jgi:hypothetical protein